jgi:hypothetical protein
VGTNGYRSRGGGIGIWICPYDNRSESLSRGSMDQQESLKNPASILISCHCHCHCHCHATATVTATVQLFASKSHSGVPATLFPTQVSGASNLQARGERSRQLTWATPISTRRTPAWPYSTADKPPTSHHHPSPKLKTSHILALQISTDSCHPSNKRPTSNNQHSTPASISDSFDSPTSQTRPDSARGSNTLLRVLPGCRDQDGINRSPR